MFNFIKKIIDKLRSSDPVYNCPVFLNEGCAHVDGLLCDYPNCNIIKSKTDMKNENVKIVSIVFNVTTITLITLLLFVISIVLYYLVKKKG